VFGVVMEHLRQPQQRNVELELALAPVLAAISVFPYSPALSRVPPVRPCGVPRDLDVVS
jgi:hypothetical protein